MAKGKRAPVDDDSDAFSEEDLDEFSEHGLEDDEPVAADSDDASSDATAIAMYASYSALSTLSFTLLPLTKRL